MHDDVSELGYVIAEALDIVHMPDTMVPARKAGIIAGVVAIDDEQIELLDVHWIFATHSDPLPATDTLPICLLTGAQSGWMETFLRPVLTASGYRVADALKPGEQAAVMLAMVEDAGLPPVAAPVVRLRRERKGDTDGSIYRYDREALVAALAATGRGR
jgi:two-component system, chemotaxis family, sensor kinase CheA